VVANGVSILIRLSSPKLYLPGSLPMRTDPFLENSQTVALELPDMRHLPTMVGFPQPAIADTKTARATIHNRGLCRVESMTDKILNCVSVIGTARSLVTRFDIIKRFSCQGMIRLAGTRKLAVGTCLVLAV